MVKAWPDSIANEVQYSLLINRSIVNIIVSELNQLSLQEVQQQSTTTHITQSWGILLPERSNIFQSTHQITAYDFQLIDEKNPIENVVACNFPLSSFWAVPDAWRSIVDCSSRSIDNTNQSVLYRVKQYLARCNHNGHHTTKYRVGDIPLAIFLGSASYNRCRITDK